MQRLTAAIGLSLVLAAPAAAQTEVTADTVLATVDGVEITAGQMIVARAQLPEQYQQLPDDVLYDGLLEQLIQQQTLANSLDADPRAVTISLENERRLLLAGEVVQMLSETAVTEEAIQATYDEAFGGETAQLEYNAAHILVETLEEAETVLARLDGGEDFGALAMELSLDPGSAANGGSLGWFGQGMMVEPFEEAVMSLEVGGTSAPVETRFGFHVITLTDTREQEAPPLEAVRAAIADSLREEAVQAAIAEMTEAATIERTDATGIDPVFLRDFDILAD